MTPSTSTGCALLLEPRRWPREAWVSVPSPLAPRSFSSWLPWSPGISQSFLLGGFSPREASARRRGDGFQGGKLAITRRRGLFPVGVPGKKVLLVGGSFLVSKVSLLQTLLSQPLLFPSGLGLPLRAGLRGRGRAQVPAEVIKGFALMRWCRQAVFSNHWHSIIL